MGGVSQERSEENAGLEEVGLWIFNCLYKIFVTFFVLNKESQVNMPKCLRDCLVCGF